MFRQKTIIQKNRSIQAILIQSQAILAIVASKTNWGATLKMSHPYLEIFFHEKWSSNWHLKSSNQKEAADRTRQQFCSIQHQQGLSCGSIGEADRKDTTNSRRSESVTSCISHQRQVKRDPGLAIQISNSRRLSNSSRYPNDSSIRTSSLSIDRYVCKLKELKVQEICDTCAGQLGNGIGLSITPVLSGANNGIYECVQKRRCVDASRTDVKSKKIPLMRRDTRSDARGDQGEQLFK
ncbi:MAG: hypothetical protein EZS28_006625 [Streblomastix strix]|uniref:Uncharacterized protein n=1 Tax=Streblomastix strix TaxID=222440 RepID=A0A5J4WTE8_9EUKA|nr:MAG: hypothetical protein EZS28_006625 [Streblomastix strix]